MAVRASRSATRFHIECSTYRNAPVDQELRAQTNPLVLRRIRPNRLAPRAHPRDVSVRSMAAALLGPQLLCAILDEIGNKADQKAAELTRVAMAGTLQATR